MPYIAVVVATYMICELPGSMSTVLMPRVAVKSINPGDTTGSSTSVLTRVQRSPPSVDRKSPVPAAELLGWFVSPVPTKMVLAVRSLGSTANAPILFVPRPRPIHCHFGSIVFSASSVRQTPPPAVPTQRRQRPCRSHNGEITSDETRPETLFSNVAV